MKILVTGVKGQLGFDVVNELQKRGHTAIGAISALAAATAAFLALKKHRCAEQKLIEEIWRWMRTA